MNAGAAAALGEHVLFLHADTELAPEALSELLDALRHEPDGAYSFSLGFSSTRLPFRILSWLAALRDRVLPFPLGDQGLGLARRLFFELGGFPDEPLFEDLVMTRRLRRRGLLRVLRSQVATSPARFECGGVWRTLARNLGLIALYAAGIPARALVRHYYGRAYIERWEADDKARRHRSPSAPVRSGSWSRRALFSIGVCLAIVLLFAAGARGAAPSPALLDRTLSEFVHDGLVDYRALKVAAADPESAFSRYLSELARGSREEEMRWSRDERLAYWINAYNAFTLKLIVDHYPIKARWYMNVFFPLRLFLPTNSILMIDGRWDRITFETARGPVTLGEIEHEILRPEFNDPRIHFAIVCASLSCPKLGSRAFRADHVQAELDHAAEAFVRDSTKVRVQGDDLEVSRIFKWFRSDFDDPVAAGPDAQATVGERYDRDSGVVRWLWVFGAEELRARIARGPGRLRHLRYDWTLNELPLDNRRSDP
jgi:hypothetical protein